ncbi:serine hydrolase [Aeromicrobium ginsengisoli]|uniref:Serine hydrolase n=1 Tax=Aeromicrobium ginsengisoli TaxID=363867 RepID=A0A5M4FBV4_9ACTN|nr:serine hydrolase [Aeromicrobium ginsengisoli]KAA1395873.1 serine hydrolase [Aeromicrobium ginsengisoli]
MRLPPLSDDVEWSVCVRDAASSRVLASLSPDRVLRTASIGKLFLLIEIARAAAAGELDLGEELRRTSDDAVADSGLWHLMRRDAFTIDDLCWLVGGFSDNLATNVLTRRIGISAVGATSASLGFVRSALLDRVRDDRSPEDPWTLSAGNADELSDLMARLHRGDIGSASVSSRVLRWVAANADLSMVAAAFGLDPLAHAEPDRGVTLVNKTGTISTVRGDVGVVTGPAGSVAYAVLASWPDDAAEDPRDRVLAEMAAIGATIRTHIGA